MTAPIRPLRRIADHGIIGNLSTVALVALDGSIDFMCWPDIDSPSLFAALLDTDRGGVFELAPLIDDAKRLQMYLPGTNVLLTRWLGVKGSAELTDFMPVPDELGHCVPRLVRRIGATRGTVSFRLRCAPRFDYARVLPKIDLRPDGAVFSSDETTVRLSGRAEFTERGGEVFAEFTLQAGESLDFVLDGVDEPPPPTAAIDMSLDKAIRYWQGWAAQSNYKGRWRDAVTRSALVLKLLTSHRHGSIAAAATFGLPEVEGGARNWDYRATWIRDASFTVYGLMRLGYQKEAAAFTRWVGKTVVACGNDHLQIMYAMDGRPVAEEAELDHLSGYGGARPVRIGNAAAGQLQLDIYGELLDSMYLSNKYGEAVSHADWLGICRAVDHVCQTWMKPDAGIWELRSEPQEHLHSRLMCWVAVDRAIRLASKRSLAAPFAEWMKVRNDIYEDIWTHFWDEEAGHFVRSKGSKDLDGAMLMMPLVRFIGSTDPAWLATLDAIGKQLNDDGLVRRYNAEDGLQGQEGAFAACSFWYVECLARAGRLEQARILFEKLMTYGNYLQLYAEEFDVRADLVGNFPQAFTHLALISAAFYLDRALEGGRSQWPG